MRAVIISEHNVTAAEAFENYHQAVFGFAYRLTRSIEVAEDITQECFLAVLRRPRSFDATRGTMKTYLFSIARNLAFKEYRDGRPEVPLEQQEAPVDTHPGLRLELSVVVERDVAALAPLQQEALILFEYHGFTLEEIARIVNANAGTVKSRLHRARANLKTALAPYRKVEKYT